MKRTLTANEVSGLDRLTLGRLAGGAIEERFGEALDRVIANILGRNTPSKDKREIKVTVGLKPDDLREHISVAIAVETKLAAPHKIGTVLFAQTYKGRAIATENDPRQGELFEEDDDAQNDDDAPLTMKEH